MAPRTSSAKLSEIEIDKCRTRKIWCTFALSLDSEDPSVQIWVHISCFGSDYLRLDGGVDDQINHNKLNHRCFIRMHVPRKAAASRELWIRELAIPKAAIKKKCFSGKGWWLFRTKSKSSRAHTIWGKQDELLFESLKSLNLAAGASL